MSKPLVPRLVTTGLLIYLLVALFEYRDVFCVMAPVVERNVAENLGEPYYSLTVELPERVKTIPVISLAALERAAAGKILVCRDTGRFTKLRTGWYLR